MNDSCLLKQVRNQELEAKKFGFYWEHFSQLMEQVQSECVEVQEAWNEKDINHLQEEVGDLIQASIALAVFCQFDPHETLLKSIEKFQRRYDIVVALAQEEGFETLHNQPYDVLMKYWNQAKVKTQL